MNEHVQEKDYFWLYIGSLAALLVAIVLFVKITESEKYHKIQKLEEEEKQLLNIRVISG